MTRGPTGGKIYIVSLTDFASIAIILSGLTGIVAAIFIARQIYHMKQSREVDTFLRLVAAGNEPTLCEASEWVKYDLKSSVAYETLYRDAQIWRRIGAVNHYFEMIGVLVNNRHLSKHLIFDQMGSWIAGTWEKLKPYIIAHREAKQQPAYCENFQLLVENYYDWIEDNRAKLSGEARSRPNVLRRYYEAPPQRDSRTVPQA